MLTLTCISVTDRRWHCWLLIHMCNILIFPVLGLFYVNLLICWPHVDCICFHTDMVQGNQTWFWFLCIFCYYISGWMFLPVPAYLGSPGQKAVKRVCVVLWCLLFYCLLLLLCWVQFFHTLLSDWLGRMFLKWPILCHDTLYLIILCIWPQSRLWFSR